MTDIIDIDLDEKFKELITSQNIQKLYPPQSKAVEAGVLNGKNIILCTPTASGKTLVAFLAIMKNLQEGKKSVYITPLKALAQEKSEEFKILQKLGYKVILEVGDLDASHVKKRQFDVLIATAEKADSILRSNPGYFEGLGALILDEIHIIHSNRGPVYEVITSRLKNLGHEIQILGLSATIGNANDLAKWIDAKLVESDWRPVSLREEVEIKKIRSLEEITKENLENGQVLVFVNTRKSAQATAEKIGRFLKIKGSEKIAEKTLNALSSPTSQCKRLADCIKMGTAFHHAGLVYPQRTLVEEGFKKGDIKVICATPTLAAGVNLPSRTVIIRDLKRYTSDGMDYIPVLEYKQQIGRAGRPKYDNEGTAITLAMNDAEAEYIHEHYIQGLPEAIYSRLGTHPTLRFHILASIAGGFTPTLDSLDKFISSTFFGYQYGKKKDLDYLIDEVLNELEEWEFIKQDEKITATPTGQRVSQLYIDPLTARNYLQQLPKAKPSNIGVLEILCDASEIRKLNVKRNEEANLWGKAHSIQNELARDISGFDLDYMFLDRFKTSLMFNDWMEEETEEKLMEDYNTTPGQLYGQLQNMDWLIYAAQELSRIKQLKTHSFLIKLGIQIKYGIREELIPLVSLKGVGRVRARKLFKNGIRDQKDLKETSINKISTIVGEKLARKIKQQIN